MARRIKAAGVLRAPADIVKPGAEIGEVLAVGCAFAFFPVHFTQTLGKVERDFSLSGFERERAIPRPAIPAIEAASLGTRMSEGSIDDVTVRNSE
jgi:hypothetical protein